MGMTDELKDRCVAFVIANEGVEHVEFTNAECNWIDREVQACTDGPNVLVTSRKPDDLPSFCTELVVPSSTRANRREPTAMTPNGEAAAQGEGAARSHSSGKSAP
jgi:hypothetical protein